MRIGQLATTLVSLASHEETKRHAVMILGPAGVGKSQIVAAVARALEHRVIDVRLSQLDPTDLRGIPGRDNGLTVWNPPSFLPREEDGPTILFLDEANAAAPAVAAAAYQLILDRKLGDYVVPDNCLIWAAGNLTTDRGITHTMPAPLVNRFMMFTVEPNLDDFRAYAAQAGVDARVMAFLSFRADYLHKFDGKTYASGQQFPTPRGWQKVSDILQIDAPDYVVSAAIRGAVGEEAGQEFSVFLKNYEGLVTVQEILSDPEKAPVPVDIGRRYAVAMALASQMDKHTADKMYAYLKRMPRDFQVLAVTVAYRRNKAEITRAAMFAEFADEIIAIMR
jgi:energy-coupling factor transporter ATP-binding protein EcfA2